MSQSIKIRNHVSLFTSQDNLLSSNGLDSTSPTTGQAGPLNSSTLVFDDRAAGLGSTTASNSSVINFNALTRDEQDTIVNVTKEYPFDYATVMFGYIMPFVLVLTIITNTLVVMVLAQRHMRTPTNIVLFTMAIVDLMTLLSPSPWYFYIYTLGYHDKFLYPPLACYAHHIMTDVIPVFFHTSSIWLALLLASQRYIYVCHPTLATTWCTVPRVRKAITIILVVAFVHQFPRFFDNTFVTVYIKYNQGYHRACKIAIAEWVHKINASRYYITYFIFRILFVFIIPCVALITLNCLLFKALRRAENKRTELLKTKFKIIGANHCSIAGSATGVGGTHSTRDPQLIQQTTQTGCQSNTDPSGSAIPLVAGGRLRDSLTTDDPISRACGERCGSPRTIFNDVSGNGGSRSMDKRRRRKFSIGSFRMKRNTNPQRSAIPASKAMGNISGKLVNQNGGSNVNDKINSNNIVKGSPTIAQSSDTKQTMTEYGFDENDDDDNLNIPVTSGQPPVRKASPIRKYQSDGIKRQVITTQRSQESNRSCPIATMRPLKDKPSEGMEGSRGVKREHLFVRDESDEADDDIEEDNDDFTCHECVAMCEARHDEFECQRCRAAAVATDCEALPQPPDGATDTRHLYHQSSSFIGGTNNTNSNTNEDASSYGMVTDNASSSIFHQHSNNMEAIEAASIQDDDSSDDDDVELDRESLLYEGDIPGGFKGTKSASTSTNRRRGIKKSVSIDSRLTCSRQPQVQPFRSSMNFRRSSSIRQRNECRECCRSGSCRAPARRLVRQSTIDPPQADYSSGGSGEKRVLEVGESKCVPPSRVGSDPCAKCNRKAQKCDRNQAIGSNNIATNHDNNSSSKDVERPAKPTLANSQSDYGRDEAIGVDRRKKITGINIFPSKRGTVATTTPTTTTTTTLHSTTANSAGSLLQAQQQPQQQQQNSGSSGRRRRASQLSSVVQTHIKSPSFASTVYGRGRGSSNLPPLMVSGSVGPTSASLRNMDSNRTTLMLIVVVTVFLMVEVPVAIVTILHVILNTLDTFKDVEFGSSLDYIKLFTNFFIMISYSVNFTIYCSMSKKFRETFRDVFLCGRRAKRKRVRRLLQEQHRQHQLQQQHQQQQYQQHQFEHPEHLQNNNTAAIPSITGDQANQNDGKNAISDANSNTGLMRFYPYRRANSQQQECEL